MPVNTKKNEISNNDETPSIKVKKKKSTSSEPAIRTIMIPHVQGTVKRSEIRKAIKNIMRKA